jgi:hypothetical protein
MTQMLKDHSRHLYLLIKIFVFLFFYTCVIVGFAIEANKIVQLPEDAGEDPYSSDYR